MEGVAPPLVLLTVVKRSIERGESVKKGVLGYLSGHDGDFAHFVTRWMAILHQGQETRGILQECSSIYRRSLLQVLEQGLKGDTIYPSLQRLEEEIIEACNDEISGKIAKLPFIIMVPLLLFQFPAFLLLLFGPLLQNFFHSLGAG